MPSRRVQKVSEAIREVVAMAILTDLKDPRVRDVTVTYAEVSADLRHAQVHVSIMGDETKQRLSLAGLQSAAGYLQGKVARRLETRYTPHLEFVLDLGVKRSLEISRILREVLPAGSASPLPESCVSPSIDAADDEPLPDVVVAPPAAEPTSPDAS